MKTCVICGNELTGKKQKYCSTNCRITASRDVHFKNNENQIEKTCKFCGLTYWVQPCRKHVSNFCKRECMSAWKSKTYKNRVVDGEWLRKMNESKTRDKVRKEGFYQCEKCDKIFDSNTSLRSHRSYCNSQEEKTQVSCSICGKTFERSRYLAFHFKMHDEKYRTEHNKNLKAGIEKRSPAKRHSKAEFRFLSSLQMRFGEENVVHKFRIPGISHEYDFYIPKLNTIVEFDGDYWHGNAKKFEINDKMRQQQTIDQKFTDLASSLGFIVERVWESETSQFLRKLDEAYTSQSEVSCSNTEQREGVRHSD